MFSEEELKAFYDGKRTGYKKEQYLNPHEEFIKTITNTGSTISTQNTLHQQFKRGYEWGSAQRIEEENS